jgi:phosphoadenosine phosphosulfate reductase
MRTLLRDDELVALNLAFDDAHPREILTWALETSGLRKIAIASAFQAEGTAIMHMASTIRADVPVLFLETGFQFAETLAFKEQLAERLYERDPERCCDLNKVRPMFEALRGLDAWVTAFRRDSSPTRADAPFVEQYELEPGHSIVKVNPVAAWTRRDTWAYLKEHDLPHNPLYDLGYASIGCAPCTRLRFTGEPERAGRWAGLSKWECGIHEREAAGR